MDNKSLSSGNVNETENVKKNDFDEEFMEKLNEYYKLKNKYESYE